MTRRQRLRRVALLCCHCLRNLAFYKAGWRNRALLRGDQFWVTANGNFLDICVLEWCKLFADSRGKHYWRKLITDPDKFQSELLARLHLAETEFQAYTEKMRAYRDKFVAHLDTEEVMHIPILRTARQSASFLYEYILHHENEGDIFHDAPQSASTFYRLFFEEGKVAYTADTAT